MLPQKTKDRELNKTKFSLTPPLSLGRGSKRLVPLLPREKGLGEGFAPLREEGNPILQ